MAVLVILGHINQQISSQVNKWKKKEDPSVSISGYLDENLVVFLEEETRDDVIARLVDQLDSQGLLYNKEKFHKAILEREKIVSTGIGIGVAIPHAKMKECSDFFIAIGIQKYKGIDWDALDGLLVRFVFMIGGPDDRQTEYLKILSRLTQSIKDEDRRRRLIKCQSVSEVLELFEGC